MSSVGVVGRIAPDVLAEQWYGFLHGVISKIQETYRRVSKDDRINQKTIAKRLGKDPATISRCLSGQTNMTMRTLYELARAMDCRLEISVQPLSELKPANRPRRDSGLGASSNTVTVEIHGA